MKLMQWNNLKSLYSSIQSSIQRWPQQHVAPHNHGEEALVELIGTSMKVKSFLFLLFVTMSIQRAVGRPSRQLFFSCYSEVGFFPNGFHLFKSPDGVSEGISVTVVCINKSKKSTEVWSFGPGHQLWSIVLEITVVIVDHFIFYKPNGRQRGLSSSSVLPSLLPALFISLWCSYKYPLSFLKHANNKQGNAAVVASKGILLF